MILSPVDTGVLLIYTIGVRNDFSGEISGVQDVWIGWKRGSVLLLMAAWGTCWTRAQQPALPGHCAGRVLPGQASGSLHRIWLLAPIEGTTINNIVIIMYVV